MNEIGKHILEARKLKGWTQEELALKMGYKSKSTINKIEVGKNDIPQSKIEKFATVLGVTVPYLMGWEGKEGVALSESEKLILEAYREADSITKDMVRRCLGLFTPDETERDVDRIVKEHMENSTPEYLVK